MPPKPALLQLYEQPVVAAGLLLAGHGRGPGQEVLGTQEAPLLRGRQARNNIASVLILND